MFRKILLLLLLLVVVVVVVVVVFPVLVSVNAQTDVSAFIQPERLVGAKWIEGLPKGIEGNIEISPQVPYFGERFYVRVIVTNKTGKPIEMLESVVFTDDEKGYHLDIKSETFPAKKHSITFISARETGHILRPWRTEWSNGQPFYSTLKNRESRTLFLDTAGFYLKDEEQKKFHEGNPRLRFAFLGKEENLSGSLSMPIRFKNKRKQFDDLKKEEKRIRREMVEEFRAKGESKDGLNQIAGAYPEVVFNLLPVDKQEELVGKYPPGDTRFVRYRLSLSSQCKYDGKGIEEYIRLYWTTPEVMRQRFSFVHLANCIRNKGEMLENDELFDALFFNFPVGFSSFWKGDLNVIYSKYYSEKKLTSEEIELRIKKIMSKPIPSYAGVGNVHLGFTLPFQKWSVSKEQVRFLYLFEEQAVFENRSFNEISVPIKNLPETEQKYIHDLIEIPKTGIMPVWKD